MVTAKSTDVMFDDVTLVASAANVDSVVVGPMVNYGTLIGIKITNGLTGPTVNASAKVMWSADGTNYYDLGGAITGTLGNSVVTSWSMTLPKEANYVKINAGGNTGQNVTIRAECVQTTDVNA